MDIAVGLAFTMLILLIVVLFMYSPGPSGFANYGVDTSSSMAYNSVFSSANQRANI